MKPGKMNTLSSLPIKMMNIIFFYNDKGYAEPKNAVTVSEAHGYGMMITAIMAGSQDKQYFDGLYRFYKAHGSDNDPSLMAWQQVKDKSGKIINTPGMPIQQLMAIWISPIHYYWHTASGEVKGRSTILQVQRTSWMQSCRMK
ncbi:glycosyl hydrolase family 8 [Peribacillus frigoritolerans]|nr:glycosyl hydrolase family 8 [Peribacillus frigoritolerans]